MTKTFATALLITATLAVNIETLAVATPGTMVYEVLTDTQRTWHDAEEACVHWGGNLASITSDAEQVLVTAAMVASGQNSNTWIGFHQSENHAPWQWSDGREDTEWQNWSPGEPNDYNHEDCTHLWNRGNWEWNDHQCTRLFWPMCGRWQEPVPEPTSDMEGDDVPEGAFDDGKFFIVNEGERFNHHDAKNACQENGGFLATVANAEEQAAVAALASAHGQLKYWLGGDEIASEGTWRWHDKSAWEYTNFNEGQPNNWEGFQQECLVIKKKTDYHWHDNLCHKQRWAVCKHFAEGQSVNTPY